MADAGEKAVLEAEQGRMNALLAGDRAALEKIFTSDYTYTHSSGRVEGRESYLSNQTGPDANKYVSFNPTDTKVSMLGPDAAIISGTVEIVRAKGTVLFLYVEVWVRQDGRWQMKFQQNTKKAA